MAVVLWFAWPESEPRAREYRDVSACLLTDGQGVASAEAAPVWAGMQDASLATRGQVRYLSVVGDQAPANARSFVGTLVLGRCAVIVASGDLAVEAVLSVAREQAQQHFIVVTNKSAALSNVVVVAASPVSSIRASVSAALADAFN
jgi:hypothetical protein